MATLQSSPLDDPKLGFPEGQRPKLKMTETDGNVFAIIGRVGQALKRAGQREKAQEWYDAATSCGSYNEVLALMFRYVDAY